MNQNPDFRFIFIVYCGRGSFVDNNRRRTRRTPPHIPPIHSIPVKLSFL